MEVKLVKFFISADGGETYKEMTCIDNASLEITSFKRSADVRKMYSNDWSCTIKPVIKLEPSIQVCLAADYLIRSAKD